MTELALALGVYVWGAVVSGLAIVMTDEQPPLTVMTVMLLWPVVLPALIINRILEGR